MKVLWICNLILPEIAAEMGLGTIPKEGWVKGLLDAILISKKANDSDMVDIALAFPVSAEVITNSEDGEKREFITGKVELKSNAGKSIEYFGFYEDVAHESVYDDKLEVTFSAIFDIAQPDIIHCFGTEFPHTLAAAKAWNRPERFLIGMQGVCSVCADRYLAHIPEKIVKRHTFRDFIKKDSILEQQKKFISRGINEREAVGLAGHIAGRTAFDKLMTSQWNDKAVYHYAGENLRKEFYSGEWEEAKAEKYRIFVSQADYPIKGFHFLLQALNDLVKNAAQYGIGDIQVYVAGQSIVNGDTLKQKIKISSYGKYLRDMIVEYGLKDRIHILGRLSAEQMKEQYLKCDTYVCCSECENSPNSLGEAMMLKVPIVTAEVGGITTVFEVGVDGYSYRNEKEDSLEQVSTALKNALLERWCAKDVDERRNNASIHAMRNHNPEANAIGMTDIYCKMMKE